MISTNQFKAGMALLLDGELYLLVEFQHVKPGKGSAFVRTKLKSIKNGAVLSKTFDAGEKFQDAFIEKRALQFQYRAGDSYHFMDLETYEDRFFQASELAEAVRYLTENLEVKGEFYESRLIGLELPTTVTIKVVESDPGLRGDTSKASMKPAILETGFKIQVPLFVEPGEQIKVDTRTGEYAGRGL
ncbi:MAG: elongation factor P [Candidatus Omnitrophica bacterium]|nr:elongation factor P [Candidatus Omnitrophota bacterium]